MTITLEEKDLREYKNKLDNAFRDVVVEAYRELIGTTRWPDHVQNNAVTKFREKIDNTKLPHLVEI